MKLTAQQLLTLADTNVLARLAAQELAPLGAYRLDRLIGVIEPEVLRVQKARNALITPEISTEENGYRRVREECMATFLDALAPLLTEDIDVAAKPITLGDIEGAKISPVHIRALGPLLKDEE